MSFVDKKGELCVCAERRSSTTYDDLRLTLELALQHSWTLKATLSLPSATRCVPCEKSQPTVHLTARRIRSLPSARPSWSRR